MKWLILLLLLFAPLVSAQSITIDGETFSFIDYSMQGNTVTFNKFTDENSVMFVGYASKGNLIKEVKINAASEFYLNGVQVTSYNLKSDDESRPTETIVLSFASIKNEETLNDTEGKTCDIKICSFMKEDMGMNVGANADMIPFSDATINIVKFSNESVGYIVIKDKKISSFDCCKSSDKPSHILTIKDLETLKEINNADDKANKFSEKLNSNEVSLKATGFFGKVGLFFGKLAMKFGWI